MLNTEKEETLAPPSSHENARKGDPIHPFCIPALSPPHRRPTPWERFSRRRTTFITLKTITSGPAGSGHWSRSHSLTHSLTLCWTPLIHCGGFSGTLLTQETRRRVAAGERKRVIELPLTLDRPVKIVFISTLRTVSQSQSVVVVGSSTSNSRRKTHTLQSGGRFEKEERRGVKP